MVLERRIERRRAEQRRLAIVVIIVLAQLRVAVVKVLDDEAAEAALLARMDGEAMVLPNGLRILIEDRAVLALLDGAGAECNGRDGQTQDDAGGDTLQRASAAS